MYSNKLIQDLNKDIEQFVQVFPIEPGFNRHFEGVSRLVMLDRYSFKDIKKITLDEGDLVVAKIKSDPKFPALGVAIVDQIEWENQKAWITVEEEFRSVLEGDSAVTGKMSLPLNDVEKPLEIFYEQIASRVAYGLSEVEMTEKNKWFWFDEFYNALSSLDFVPAGRVLHGAGADTNVTYFNCYVMPFPKDSRGGIGEHRNTVMEIMSRGGGVGTNGSTLRPRNALARGVNGKSSGSVSWLNDIANLTNLVEQGGSRRGAQMIMLADWHPDVLEFIISKMQNPKILKFIFENIEDEQIKSLAKDKLKFTPLNEDEKNMYIDIISSAERNLKLVYELTENQLKSYEHAKEKYEDGGVWSVHNSEFLTGANISIALTHEFMNAVENDEEYELVFPDVENYNEEEMEYYNEYWHECGDTRAWFHEHDMDVKVHRTIKARDLWNLINICATYSAEPGVFFIDNANDMTNAAAYSQKVVATNPCGEQPLAPYSVCNLSAVNLANMKKLNKDTNKWEIDLEHLEHTVRVGVRMQDNIIDATPYFLEANEIQARGERRLGLGVMGLHDLLIYLETIYGSEEGNELVDLIFKTISHAAYRESIDLAKEKGAFPFLMADLDDETQFMPADHREAFINSGFMKTMPEDIRNEILIHGIRNSHLLTVAPTGSTGTMIGVSTGLEPYFSFSYFRSGRLGKFIEVKAKIVEEYLQANPEAKSDNLPDFFVSAMELSPEAHADVQCIIQKHVDSSLSKTVNAPEGYSVDQVQSVYERLWKGGAKGGTVYVDKSRDAQVLSLTADDNSNKQSDAPAKEKSKVYLVDTIQPLKETGVTIGNEIGDTCPVCQKGTVIDRGGCAECDNCSAQLRCGL